MNNSAIDAFYLKWESLSSKNSFNFLNEFIENLGFQKYPIWQKLILHSLLKPVIKRWVQVFINSSARRLGFDYLVTANDFFQGLKPNKTIDQGRLTLAAQMTEINK